MHSRLINWTGDEAFALEREHDVFYELPLLN
jgi:hypothetical protein